MERIPSDPEERERILKNLRQRKDLVFPSAPPICPECDAGDPTSIITECDCLTS